MRRTLGDRYRISLMVLFILMISNFFMRIDVYLIGVTSSEMQTDQGWGPGNGTGYQYDILVGPVYTTFNIMAALPVGYIIDKTGVKITRLLSIIVIIESASVACIGFSQKYYQVVICRIVIACCTAFSSTLCASLIADYFDKTVRASAFAIYNFSVYLGFSIAYGIGNVVTDTLGWRYAWLIIGFTGMGYSIVILCIPEPNKNNDNNDNNNIKQNIKYSTIGDNESEMSDLSITSKKFNLDYNQIMKKKGNNGSERHSFPASTPRTSIDATTVVFHRNKDNNNSKVTFGEICHHLCHSKSLILLFFASFYRNCGGWYIIQYM